MAMAVNVRKYSTSNDFISHAKHNTMNKYITKHMQ